ncbi:uncharacterized protein LOC143420522 [Maylandia zebra]|uniref:uncharacterized protein LOC143420522 n=1 Tax=Maylandia zebra TaxID=106582 RepID=UPI00403D2542
MTLLCNLMLGFCSLAIIMTRKHICQGAGQQGCCTSYTKPRAVNIILRHRQKVELCWKQGITEWCNIEAVVLKWRHRYICVDPKPRKMHKLVERLCNRRKNG